MVEQDLLSRLDALEADNHRLQQEVAELRAEMSGSAVPITRRQVLKKAAMVGAGAVAGGLLLNAQPAEATTGAMQFGATNDAGTDDTVLQSSATNTLHLKNSLTSGGTTVGRALLIENVSATAAPTLSVWPGGNGAGVEVKKAGTTSGFMLYTEGGAHSFYANKPQFGITIDQPEADAIRVLSAGGTVLSGNTLSSTAIAVSISGGSIGLSSGTSGEVGVRGSCSNTNGGIGVLGNANGTLSRAIDGEAIGDAIGVVGNADSNAGVHGQSHSGRGGQFRSDLAGQVRLIPSKGRLKHPVSGKTGDLFVNRGGHLWYCLGNSAWKQLA